MIIEYTALCDFTASLNGKHKQFKCEEIYNSDVTLPELDMYIEYGLVAKKVVELTKTDKKPIKK